ncbi:MAG TPA: TetR-like C-terminal domain-containing protein [Candidatus Dormibacteraeota bacterium]|nr:TetR-like C-terminal domain-containing protein [Candidatus Dormibacteraeota bacterium]
MGIDIVVLEQGTQPIPHSGSLRDDLIEFTRFRLRTWTTPFFRQVVLPILLEAQANKALADVIGTRFTEYRVPLVTRLRRSIEAGELREDVDPNRVLDFLMGPASIALMFGQPVPSESEAESIVDQVLAGLAPRPR